MTSTNNGRAADRLLGHARALALEAPLCGILTADEEVANHCIAQSIKALTKRNLAPIHFLEETDYLWDVFTECRARVDRGYNAAKGSIGNYAWKCARSAAVRFIATYDTTRLYGSCANVRAPEMVFHGTVADGDADWRHDEYNVELKRDATGQLCHGMPDEEPPDMDRAELEHYIVRLDCRAQEIIRLYFFKGLSLREIGVCMHLTAERINMLRHQALEKLRLIMEGREA